jgi:hypothetical protein
MFDFIPWVGLAVLVLLCLPIPLMQRVILQISSWALRLAIIGLLLGGAYLWFRPDAMPGRVSAILADFPGLLALLPDRGSPAFGLCLACWLATALVPIVVVFDVARRPSLVHTRSVVEVEAEPVLPVAEQVLEEMGVPVLRPVERRTAAAALASAGSRITH